MKKALKAVVAGIAVLSVGTLAACTSHHSSHDPKKLKEHVEASLKKVDATDEQRLKIGAVTDRIIADGGDLCKSSQGLGKKIADCLLLDKPDKEWLHRTVDEKAGELTAFAHRTVDSLIEISGVLTSGQRTKLQAGYEAAHGKK